MKIEQVLSKLNIKVADGRIVEYRPTGINTFDRWVGGGIPKANITLLWGDEKRFKSTTALIMARNAVARGERVIWIDTENWFSNQYADDMGLMRTATDSGGDPLFYYLTGNNAEELLEASTQILKNGFADWMFIDSITNLAPQAEVNANTGQQQVAVQARLMNTWLRKSMAHLMDSGTSIVGIAQVRVAIGTYGAPTMMAGGKAVRHQSALRIQFMKAEYAGAQATVTLKMDKNKVALNVPGSIVELGFVRYGSAFDVDESREAMNIGMASGVLVNSSGTAWKGHGCFFEGQLIGNGKAKVLEFLDQNPEVRARVIQAANEKGYEVGVAITMDDEALGE